MYSSSQGYGCGAGCGSCASYSGGLERIAESYQGNTFANEVSYDRVSYAPVALNQPIYSFSSTQPIINYRTEDLKKFDYSKTNSNYVNELILSKVNQNYSFIPDNFLRPNKKRQRFIGKAEEIQDYIEEAFRELMDTDFPDDIRIKVCEEKELRKLAPNPGVVGLSINRKKECLVSDILVLNGELDKVMLTIGHEIGHVMTETLPDKRDEEAKAFAFSFAWMKSIREKDIAGLGNSIADENPAKNGIHDLACNFVVKLIEKGREAFDVFVDLVRRNISIDS